MGTGEAAAAELRDGTILYSSRRHWFSDDEPWYSGRLQAYSTDGGRTFRDAVVATLPDGPRYRGAERRDTCYNGHFGMEAGLVRLSDSERDVLLYSNADQPGHERTRMTVWASFDGGATWPLKRLVYPGPSAYSSLAAGRPGTAGEGWIFLQFEQHKGPGRLARFNLAWLLEGERADAG
jgi:sialidase-1